MASRKKTLEYQIAQGKQTSRDVLALSRQGANLSEIARELSITPSGAYKAYWRGMAEVEDELPVLARNVRARQLQFCDRSIRKNWTAALQGDDDANARVHKAMEVERKLLGLDVKEAPNPQEDYSYHGSLEERRQQAEDRIREMLAPYLLEDGDNIIDVEVSSE